jgi:triacylglycerol lipase
MLDVSFADTFEITTRDYSRPNAYWLGNAARLSYHDPATIQAAVAAWGLDEFLFFDKLETQAFIAGNDRLLIVAFRGTTALLDWIFDARIDLIGGPAGRVHEGFNVALSFVWLDIWNYIKEQLRGRALWVTGHSLGAALATLAVAKLRLERDEAVSGLYTFGQPRAGDLEFARVFDLDFGQQAFRYVNDQDIVSRVPLRLMQYSHVGTFKWFDEHGVQQDQADWWDIVTNRIREPIENLIPRLLPVTDNLLARFEARVPKRFQSRIEAIEDHSMDQYVANLEKALVAAR